MRQQMEELNKELREAKAREAALREAKEAAEAKPRLYGPYEVEHILALAAPLEKALMPSQPKWDIKDRDAAVATAFRAFGSSWCGWSEARNKVESDLKWSIEGLMAPWGVGTGKTTLGEYIFNKVTTEGAGDWMADGRVFKYVYVQGNGGYDGAPLQMLDGKESKLSGRSSASLRLLIGGLELDPDDAVGLLRRLDLDAKWTMHDVVEILRVHWMIDKDTPLGLFIHVDEVQAIVDKAGQDRYRAVRRGFTNYLYQNYASESAQHNVFPMFYFSGVLLDSALSEGARADSGQITLLEMDLRPLSDENVMTCLGAALGNDVSRSDLEESDHIMHTLHLTGNIPRPAVEMMAIALKTLAGGEASLKNVGADALARWMSERFEAQYGYRMKGLLEGDRPYFKKLVLDVLRGVKLNEVPGTHKLLACSIKDGRLAAPPLLLRLMLSKLSEDDPTVPFSGDLLKFANYGDLVLPLRRMSWEGFEAASALSLALGLSPPDESKMRTFKELFKFANTDGLDAGILGSEVKLMQWSVKKRKEKERMFANRSEWTGDALEFTEGEVYVSAKGEPLVDIALVIEREGDKDLLLFVQCKAVKGYGWADVKKNVHALSKATAGLAKRYERVYALALSRFEADALTAKKKKKGLALPVMVLGPKYFPPVLAACMHYAKPKGEDERGQVKGKRKRKRKHKCVGEGEGEGKK